MKRKVSICTLCASAAQSESAYLEQKLRQYYPDAPSADYGDAASFADAVAKCACEGGIVVAAAPLSAFLSAKLRLLKLFSSKIVRNSAISSAVQGRFPEGSKERDLHTAIPEKSKVFMSEDGMYSAFAKELGEGMVVFMPLESGRTQAVFALGFENLLKRAFPAASQPQKPPAMVQVRESVQKVIGSGKTVAVASCGSAKALLSVISAVPDSEDAFIPDSSAAEIAEGEKAEDFITRSAKESKESANADLGIAISDVHSDSNGESYVVVSVADSERANAARVFAVPGEDKKHLIAAAVIKLCSMLEIHSGTDGLVNPNIPEKKDNKRTALLIAIFAIVLATVICFIAAAVLGNEYSQASLMNAGNVNIVAQTTPADEEPDYYGGNSLDDEDMDMVILFPETTTGEASTTDTITSATLTVAEKTTKIITTIATTIKTTKPTTTAATTAQTTTRVVTTATTTQKPAETTAVVTTTAKADESTSGTTAVQGGKFVFKVYGYGHGVGMSQRGAIAATSRYLLIITPAQP